MLLKKPVVSCRGLTTASIKIKKLDTVVKSRYDTGRIFRSTQQSPAGMTLIKPVLKSYL
ncbi:hypothetical protein [Rickettsia sp.]|uniref:hypothetical protein n=1 Tax=Rickettsia sp. TaxID=789 RepID=UPI0039787521